MEAEADTALGVNIMLFLAADSHESMAPLGHIHMHKYSITIYGGVTLSLFDAVPGPPALPTARENQ